MLKTVRYSPIMTGVDKSFDASIPKISGSQKPHAFTTLLHSLPPAQCPISWPSTSTLKSALALYGLAGRTSPRPGLETNCGFFSAWLEVHVPLIRPHLTPLLCHGAGTFLALEHQKKQALIELVIQGEFLFFIAVFCFMNCLMKMNSPLNSLNCKYIFFCT